MVGLKDALEKRDNYLKKHPHLKKYQKEIDNVLDKCSSQEHRLLSIFLMLNCKLDELKKTLNE
jgi:hypothetical protein